jgi:valyl-tRNA synthetase
VERWIRSRAAATTAAVDRGLADYHFGEVTRALYDGIWSEFCDWGIELAKVRLADESLAATTREATWWTLVDALDTYLRLLHPVMPFVTEAIWEALPRRADDAELLVVSRWPASGASDAEADRGIGEVIETIVAIRNARATADVPAGSWLEVQLAPSTASRSSFEAVAPAIGRLARARPLVLVDGPSELARPSGALDVVLPSGAAELTILPAAVDGEAAGRDRGRLEKELAEAEGYLAAARARLANASFTERAPAPVVEGARERERELAAQVERLRERLAG